MRGLPSSSSLRKFSWCVGPGEYVLHAIDQAGDGWYGGAYYTVIVDGVVAVREEMATSMMQTTTVTVLESIASRTSFSENKAMQGGGGALFWEDAPPEHTESYRNKSASNAALYGDYVATPTRELATLGSVFDFTSGHNTTTTTDEATGR